MPANVKDINELIQSLDLNSKENKANEIKDLFVKITEFINSNDQSFAQNFLTLFIGKILEKNFSKSNLNFFLKELANFFENNRTFYLDEEKIRKILDKINDDNFLNGLTYRDLSNFAARLSSLGVNLELINSINPSYKKFFTKAFYEFSNSFYDENITGNAISFLLHTKNLGILEEEPYKEQSIQVLTKIINFYNLDYLEQNFNTIFSQIDASQLVEIILYAKNILKIDESIINNFQRFENILARNFKPENPQPSKTQTKIINQIVSFLTNPNADLQEWQHVPAKKEGVVTIAGVLEIITEGAYGELGDDKIPTKNCDILVRNKLTGEIILVIEVDGPSHFITTKTGFRENPKTETRNRLLSTILPEDRIIKISQDDFDKLQLPHYNSQELRAAQQEFFAEKLSPAILLIQQSMQEVQEAAIHAEKEAQEEPTKKADSPIKSGGKIKHRLKKPAQNPIAIIPLEKLIEEFAQEIQKPEPNLSNIERIINYCQRIYPKSNEIKSLQIDSKTIEDYLLEKSEADESKKLVLKDLTILLLVYGFEMPKTSLSLSQEKPQKQEEQTDARILSFRDAYGLIVKRRLTKELIEFIECSIISHKNTLFELFVKTFPFTDLNITHKDNGEPSQTVAEFLINCAVEHRNYEFLNLISEGKLKNVISDIVPNLLATSDNRPSLIKYLKDHQLLSDKIKSQIFEIAIQHDLDDVVLELINLGYPHQSKTIGSSDGNINYLQCAAYYNSVRVGKILIESGHYCMVEAQNGLPPLHRAIEENNPEFTRLLLENGANPLLIHETSRYLNLPLTSAIRRFDVRNATLFYQHVYHTGQYDIKNANLSLFYWLLGIIFNEDLEKANTSSERLKINVERSEEAMMLKLEKYEALIENGLRFPVLETLDPLLFTQVYLHHTVENQVKANGKELRFSLLDVVFKNFREDDMQMVVDHFDEIIEKTEDDPLKKVPAILTTIRDKQRNNQGSLKNLIKNYVVALNQNNLDVAENWLNQAKTRANKMLREDDEFYGNPLEFLKKDIIFEALNHGSQKTVRYINELLPIAYDAQFLTSLSIEGNVATLPITAKEILEEKGLILIANPPARNPAATHIRTREEEGTKKLAAELKEPQKPVRH